MQFLCSLLLKYSEDLEFKLMAGNSLMYHRNQKAKNCALGCFPKTKSILTSVS